MRSMLLLAGVLDLVRRAPANLRRPSEAVTPPASGVHRVCGQKLTGLAGLQLVCARPAGHNPANMHRSEAGTEWTETVGPFWTPARICAATGIPPYAPGADGASVRLGDASTGVGVADYRHHQPRRRS